MIKKPLLTVACMFCIILLLSMFGCSSNLSMDKSENKTPVIGNEKDESYGNGIKENSTTQTTTNKPNDAMAGRKVIFTAELEIESTQYNKSIETLDKMIIEFGGYVQDSSIETSAGINSDKTLRKATYTIRIPSGKLTSFMAKSGNIGNITLNTSKGEDVTDQYFDAKAHLSSLEIQEGRLLEILKKATVLKDIIDLEERISQVRYEIELLTGSLRQLESRVDLSTVTVNIFEVETLTKPKPASFWSLTSQTFSTSISALVTTFKYIALVIVAVSPFAVVLGIILLIAFFVYKRFIRK